MKKYSSNSISSFLFLFLIIVSCGLGLSKCFDNEKSFKENTPTEREILEVIKNVIILDSGALSKPKPYLIIDTLSTKWDQYLLMSVMVFQKRNKNLINNNGMGFSDLDSLFASWQSRNSVRLKNHIKVDESQLVSRQEVQININRSLSDSLYSYSYSIISRPLFSLNKNVALITVDTHIYYHKGYEGGGMAYILEKQNGHWKIVKKWMCWAT